MLNFSQIKANYPKAHQKLIAWACEIYYYSALDLQNIAAQTSSNVFERGGKKLILKEENSFFTSRDLYDFFGIHDIKITLFGIIRYDGEFEYAPLIWYFSKGWHTTYLDMDNCWHERDGSGKNYMPTWGFTSQKEAETIAFEKGFEILERKLNF